MFNDMKENEYLKKVGQYHPRDTAKPFQIHRSMKDLRKKAPAYANFPAEIENDAWHAFRYVRHLGYVLSQDGYVIGFYGVMD